VDYRKLNEVTTLYVFPLPRFDNSLDLELLQNLAMVFNRFHQAGLQLKPTMCHLVRKEITYLGIAISDYGVVADPKKVDAVRAFPVPTDWKHLSSF